MAACPLSIVVPLSCTYSNSDEVEEDSKVGIISDARHMEAKRKAILAMDETINGAPNVTKWV